MSYEERPRAQLRGLEAPQTEPARRLSARSPRDRERTQVKTNHTARTIRKKRARRHQLRLRLDRQGEPTPLGFEFNHGSQWLAFVSSSKLGQLGDCSRLRRGEVLHRHCSLRRFFAQAAPVYVCASLAERDRFLSLK